MHDLLYRTLYRVRRVEEEIARIYPTDKLKSPVHLSIGQEAVAAAMCAPLTREDTVFCTYRGHAAYLAKGGDLPAMMAEIYGKAAGCCGGKGGSMHLVDLAVGFLGATPIVASTIPIAVGAAFGSVLQGQDRVTAAFFGEGATEEGVFHESVNFAALKKLATVTSHSRTLREVPLRATSYAQPARQYGVGNHLPDLGVQDPRALDQGDDIVGRAGAGLVVVNGRQSDDAAAIAGPAADHAGVLDS